jgi:hypothetical protein
MTSEDEEFEFRARAEAEAAAARKPSAKAAAPKPTLGQTMADIAQSAPTKLAQGIAGMVGLPGDIAQGVKAAQYAIDPKYQEGSFEPWNVLPTSKNVNTTLAKALNGYKEPTTTAGQYTGTALSFIPSAVAGTGSIGKRVLESAASGLASEAGGQVAKGTPLEGVARLAGALSTGAGTNIVKNVNAAVKAEKLIPSIENIKEASSGLYDAADNAGLIISGSKIKQEASKLKNILANEGIDKNLHPAAFAAMNRFLKTQGNVTLKGVETLRRIASDATTTANKADRRMARIIVDHVDDFVGSLKPTDTMGVDPTAATKMLSTARDLWKKSAKAQTVEDLITKAKSNPEGIFNFENAVKAQFTKLANNARGMARFSPEEQAAIQKVAKGETIQNIQRLIGKFAPTNPLTLYGPAAVAVTNPMALLVPAAGSIAKTASTLTAAKNAKAASQLIRGGVKPTKVPILDRRALLAAQMATQDQEQ